MLDVDDKQLKQYEKDLQTFARSAFPHATKATLNKAAFETRKGAQMNIRWNMVNRNRFTEQSVQVEMARGLLVEAQQAVVGSTADYMYRQEFGGQASKGGKYKAAIPTSYAAGQDGAQPRTKLPRKVNTMQQIQLRKRLGTSVSRRQYAFLSGLIAAREGDKFVFIPGATGSDGGIYRVWGRDKKRGQFRGIKMKMVWSMRKAPTRTPRNQWLAPATDDARGRMRTYYRDALLYQLQRHGVLGY